MFTQLQFNRIRLTTMLCTALAVTTLPLLVRADDDRPAAISDEPAKSLDPPDAGKVAELPKASAKEGKMSSAAADALLEKHLKRFMEETDGMLDSRLDGIKGFFDERKQGARLYASQTLDLSAKCRAVGSLLENLFTATAEFLGMGPSGGPDSFSLYVRRCFRENVLDPAQARQAMEDAIAGFRGDVAEAEGRLLVALKADIGDDAIDTGRAVSNGAAEARILGLCDALVNETVDAAINDLNASLGMFLVSNFLSDKVADKVTPEDASRGGRIVSNLAANVAVDAALEKGIRAMGYDPESKVVARVNAGIDRICAAIIDGDPVMSEIYPTLSILRRMHPDPAVRNACRRVDEAVEQAENLGLRRRLQRVRNERHRGLWKALMTQLAGPGAAQSPFMMYGSLKADEWTPADQIIRWADSLFAAYRARN